MFKLAKNISFGDENSVSDISYAVYDEKKQAYISYAWRAYTGDISVSYSVMPEKRFKTKAKATEFSLMCSSVAKTIVHEISTQISRKPCEYNGKIEKALCCIQEQFANYKGIELYKIIELLNMDDFDNKKYLIFTEIDKNNRVEIKRDVDKYLKKQSKRQLTCNYRTALYGFYADEISELFNFKLLKSDDGFTEIYDIGKNEFLNKD